ncbi:hypothetical protein ACJX0J_022422, partial [Zea mays]
MANIILMHLWSKHGEVMEDPCHMDDTNPRNAEIIIKPTSRKHIHHRESYGVFFEVLSITFSITSSITFKCHFTLFYFYILSVCYKGALVSTLCLVINKFTLPLLLVVGLLHIEEPNLDLPVATTRGGNKRGLVPIPM